MAKRGVTQATMAADWSTGLTNAATTGGTIQKGIQAVTTAPGVTASQNVTKWINGVAAAGPKWAARVSAVSLQSWQTVTVEKGITQGRIAAGASTAGAVGGKFYDFAGILLTDIQQGLQTLGARGLPSANKARMDAWYTWMTGFRQRHPTV